MTESEGPLTPQRAVLPSDELLPPGPRLERWLSLAALAVLLMGPMLLGWMWLTAWHEGLPLFKPDDWGSNHGPWRHQYHLIAASGYALGLPLLAVPLALLALCFRRTGLAAGVLLALPIYEVLALVGLFPMLD